MEFDDTEYREALQKNLMNYISVLATMIESETQEEVNISIYQINSLLREKQILNEEYQPKSFRELSNKDEYQNVYTIYDNELLAGFYVAGQIFNDIAKQYRDEFRMNITLSEDKQDFLIEPIELTDQQLYVEDLEMNAKDYATEIQNLIMSFGYPGVVQNALQRFTEILAERKNLYLEEDMMTKETFINLYELWEDPSILEDHPDIDISSPQTKFDNIGQILDHLTNKFNNLSYSFNDHTKLSWDYDYESSGYYIQKKIQPYYMNEKYDDSQEVRMNNGIVFYLASPTASYLAVDQIYDEAIDSINIDSTKPSEEIIRQILKDKER